MGRYKDIRDAAATLVQGVQLGGSGAFAEVAKAPKNNFIGYPAACVIPGGVESQYITVAQNQRGYGLNIFVYYPIDQEDWAAAINTMLDLLDAVLDALDQSIDLNGVADFLEAVPFAWDVVNTTAGKTLVCSIHAVAKKDVDVR